MLRPREEEEDSCGYCSGNVNNKKILDKTCGPVNTDNEGGPCTGDKRRERKRKDRAECKDCTTLLDAYFITMVLNLRCMQFSWLCDSSQTIFSYSAKDMD
jgi:hypothetical protein